MQFHEGMTVLIALIVSSLSLGMAAQYDAKVDRSASFIVARTHSSGLLSFLGHDHAILAKKWFADVCMSTDDISKSSVKIHVLTKSLEIDTREALSKTDLEDAPDKDDRKEIQEKMLGPKFLATDRFPVIQFISTEVRKNEELSLAVTGPLTLRGQTKVVTISMEAETKQAESDKVRFGGSFKIKQSEFGMEPESVAGVVKVADEVTIRFNLWLRRTNEPCGT